MEMDTREHHYQVLRAVVLTTAQTLLPRRHNELWETTIAAGELEPKRKWTYLLDGLDFILSGNFSKEDIAKVDALLAYDDKPQLSAISERWSREYRRVIRAGKLRTNADADLVTKILALNTVHPSERADLARMLNEYRRSVKASEIKENRKWDSHLKKDFQPSRKVH
jgi:hypothetical protein